MSLANPPETHQQGAQEVDLELPPGVRSWGISATHLVTTTVVSNSHFPPTPISSVTGELARVTPEHTWVTQE